MAFQRDKVLLVPYLVTIDSELVVLKIGRLTERDLTVIGERLRLLLGR